MIDQLADRHPAQGSYDPLDLHLDRLRVPGARADSVSTPARRERQAWSSGLQIPVLLIAGIALGRHGLAILNESTLSLIDPVIPVALAALGVLAAFEAAATPWVRGRLIAAVSIQALTAAAVVAAGTLAFVLLTGDVAYASPSILAIALGVCASSSSALATGDAAARSSVTRLVDLDALVAIVAGGLVIVAMREQNLLPALSITAQIVGIAVTVAITGWLLLTRTVSDTEQRVFGAATLLLLGGVADYLSLSALVAGVAAGAFWHAVGGAPGESLRRDLAHVQHPLVALVLLAGGARTEFTPGIVALAVAYVLLRGVGKLAGSLAAGLVDPALSRGVAPRLLSPGILAVAFALNALRAGGPDMTAVLSVAVLGTIGSQLLAGVRPPEDGV
ncbi:MAG TPA: hypothetical protein VIX63_05750 [Vicinamibacterales bacterium]